MADERIVQLEANVSIAQAESLSHQLEAAFSDGSPVVLDASAVERADTAGLQVVLAFFQSMQESGVSVRLEPVSEAMTRAIDLLGLRPILLGSHS